MISKIKMTLNIFTNDITLRNLLFGRVDAYRRSDSGFDIPMIHEHVSMNNMIHIFDLNVKVAAVDIAGNPVACMLLPRSSLSATPFRLANSIGLIDSGYRGVVKAKVDVLSQLVDGNEFQIDHGARLFQICQHNFLPWREINIVQFENELPNANDNRGAGGFGSTN